MKILLLVKNFDFGGAENHVCDLANALQQMGQDVIVISNNGRQALKLLPEVNHIRLKFSPWKIPTQIPFLVRLIRNEKISIIHTHQHLPNLLGSLVGKFTKTPQVITIHGRARHDLRYLLWKKDIQKIIAISQNSLKGMLTEPKLKDKTVLIPNGIRFSENSHQIRQNELLLYYASRIDKRHAKLIKEILLEVWPPLLATYSDAKFRIIGDGKELKKLKKLVDSSELKLSVQFVGYKSDISTELKKASLVLGVGRVAIESLSLGIPVFSIKHGRGGRLITQSNYSKIKYGNFVDLESRPPSASQILTTFEEFLSNRAFYNQEAEMLRKEMAAEFDIQKIAQSTLSIYQEVVEKS